MHPNPVIFAAAASAALMLGACDSGTTHVIRYPDGKIRERWQEKSAAGGRALREGSFQSFYPDGGPQSALEYHAGRKQGRAEIRDRRGRVVFQGRYEDDFLRSETRYDTSGREVFTRAYGLGQNRVKAAGPDGDSIEVEEVCAEIEAKPAPVKQGLCRMAYPGGGVLATRYYAQGRLQGEAAAWYPDGSPWMSGAYANGVPDGLWRAWSRKHQLSWSARFAAGLRDGPWKEWYPDGKPKCESHFRAGRQAGPYREWYPGGKPRLAADFRDGIKDGAETAWYPDGRRLYSASYVTGKLQGDFYQWYPGGTLRLHCRFEDGRKEGWSRVFHRQGGLLERAFYRAGRLQGPYRAWTEDGKILVSKQFRAGAVAFDSKAKQLLDMLGAESQGAHAAVPVGLEGFYWGMDRDECRANLSLLQAVDIRDGDGEIAARFTAFSDRRPTPARVRLQFSPQGELWGIRLDVPQKSSADFFPLYENLEGSLGGDLGKPVVSKEGSGARYAMAGSREWGSFYVTSGERPPVRQRLPVIVAEAFSPGAAGWFRFSLVNNLYREYANPANASISQPVWPGEAFLAGR